MRFYDVAVASLAIEAPTKWTDNVLSQFKVPEVISSHRGVARRIPYSAVVRLAIIRALSRDVGLTVAGAVQLADRLLQPDHQTGVSLGSLRIACDLAALERELGARLADALESAPRPRRGRPQKGVRA